jgi:hypothetical protein
MLMMALRFAVFFSGERGVRFSEMACAAPVGDGASVIATVSEIEISPEMLAAGFRVLRDSGLSGEYQEEDKLVVARIFRAMLSAANKE